MLSYGDQFGFPIVCLTVLFCVSYVFLMLSSWILMVLTHWRGDTLHIANLLVDDSVSCSMLCRSLSGKVVADLMVLCKSHKEEGHVTHRAIHANPDYRYAGLSL